jgi:hypothetical protein
MPIANRLWRNSSQPPAADWPLSGEPGIVQRPPRLSRAWRGVADIGEAQWEGYARF